MAHLRTMGSTAEPGIASTTKNMNLLRRKKLRPMYGQARPRGSSPCVRSRLASSRVLARSTRDTLR
eukprot:4381290-Prymnesium_polylepis.1